MKATKIDWCDCTINPVVGCPNGCEYCYARRINERFGFVNKWEEPVFFEERLSQFNSKKPSSVFIDSMSDIGCWKDEWLYKTIRAIEKNPQHKYIALTKKHAMTTIAKINEFYNGESQIFIGKSVTNQQQFDNLYNSDDMTDFLSIEPLHSPIDFGGHLAYCTDFVIVGAETGNRKGKIVPEKQWVREIVGQCNEENIGVFMKESLRDIMGDEFRQDKLPWSVK